MAAPKGCLGCRVMLVQKGRRETKASLGSPSRTAVTGVWRDCKESRPHKQWGTDRAQEHLEFQGCLDHLVKEDHQAYQEKEAKLESQETWGHRVSQAVKAHLVHLVSRVSEGRPASTD